MTEEAIKKMQKQVRKDGSLSEERKNELLKMLAAMMPEMIKLYKSHKTYALSMTGLNDNHR
jgi:hypothetical protein